MGSRGGLRFHKYQALGNDYLVVDGPPPDPALVRRLCDRHYGVGSDGVLVADGFSVRIFNPDGSEAEKSGNGIRIYARYLWDNGLTSQASFRVVTIGGTVVCDVQDGGRRIAVDMGEASFDSAVIPVAGPPRDVVDEPIDVAGERLRFTAVTVGNPHCVVLAENPTPELATRLGPLLERHDNFPNRTNVQFVKVLDRNRIKIEIWERGAGYTLASGSSSCASAAACVRLGLCDRDVTVVMPGGELEINVSQTYAVRMTGPASKVADGVIAEELLTGQGRPEELA